MQLELVLQVLLELVHFSSAMGVFLVDVVDESVEFVLDVLEGAIHVVLVVVVFDEGFVFLVESFGLCVLHEVYVIML